MGRIEKIKRELIEEANKRILGEQKQGRPDLIEYIRSNGESVYKMLDALKNMMEKIETPEMKMRKPNLYQIDRINDYGVAISKLFKTLERATPFTSEDDINKFKVMIHRLSRDAYLSGQDLQKTLYPSNYNKKLYIFTDIVKGLSDLLFHSISAEKAPIEIVAKREMRRTEEDIENAERGIDKWWREVSNQLIKPLPLKQLEPGDPCKKLSDSEIVVVYKRSSKYVGPQDIIGTYIPSSPSGQGGFTPKVLDRSNAEDQSLIMYLENGGYNYKKDIVRGKNKPDFGLFVFKDELNSPTTRLSNITSSDEIQKMINHCKSQMNRIP